MNDLRQKKIAETIKDAVLKGEHLKMVVKTDCMRPALGISDKVIARKYLPYNLQGGDIILYMVDYVSYVHRFIFKMNKDNKLFLITKPDKALFFNMPIQSSALLGKVAAVEKDGRYINLESVLWRIINRFLGHFYFLEGVIFAQLRFIKRKIFNNR